ncbi:MAG: rod shape-determining protein MreC [Desulfobacterales bacterium]|nr:rod shape-determining protein MreC [Desulfobacterales bacterium]
MFSKKLVTIFCLIIVALINVTFLSISTKHCYGNTIVDRVVIAGIAPFQEAVTQAIRFCERIWSHYFCLVNVREESDQLKKALAAARLERGQGLESKLAHERLRKLLDMKAAIPKPLLPAQVVGVDPSGWFKTVIVNRGSYDGVSKGMPVIAPQGIVGQIMTASYHYSKVLLIIDRSSAIDALVQRTRSRGIVEGEIEESCRFKYVLRKADISIGDTVISSGLDGVFPKGFRVGCVEKISKGRSGIFQKVKVRPFVDFTRLEEALVILE